MSLSRYFTTRATRLDSVQTQKSKAITLLAVDLIRNSGVVNHPYHQSTNYARNSAGLRIGINFGHGRINANGNGPLWGAKI